MSTANMSVFIIPALEHVIVLSPKLLLNEGQIQLREVKPNQVEARASVGREW